jgi:hypothetical protein
MLPHYVTILCPRSRLLLGLIGIYLLVGTILPPYLSKLITILMYMNKPKAPQKRSCVHTLGSLQKIFNFNSSTNNIFFIYPWHKTCYTTGVETNINNNCASTDVVTKQDALAAIWREKGFGQDAIDRCLATTFIKGLDETQQEKPLFIQK